MYHSTLLVSIALAVLSIIPVTAQIADNLPPLSDEQMSKIQIPMDHAGPIFTYDATGGFQRVAPPANPVEKLPRLSIYPDGKIVTGGQDQQIQSCEMQISSDELNRFLNFLINENRFYDIQESALKEQLKSSPPERFIADAPTSHFAVDLQDGRHIVEIYALTFAVQAHPANDDLVRLLKIEKRCQQLVAMAHLGNEKQQNELLKSVNDRLHVINPSLDPLSLDHVQWATRFRNGNYQVSFQRIYPASETQPTRTVTARFIQKGPDAEAEITITGAGDMK